MRPFLLFLCCFSSIVGLNGAPTPILVTGGAGYIGSATCKALSKAGYLPICYDLKPPKKCFGPSIQGDILDRELLKKVLTEFKPPCVIHFAGLISVPASVEDPFTYYLNNFLGTLSLLQTMKECGVHQIIFSSTASLYGNQANTPIKENLPTTPLNPYARSKRFAEEIIQEWTENSPLHYVIFRYFNAAGADIEGGIGQIPLESHHLITNCLKATLSTKEISIFGTDFSTPDGSAVRDYIHVMDLADAHVKAVSYLLKNGSSEIINLGTGKGLSVKEIVTKVQEVTKIPLKIQVANRRNGDPPMLIADIEKATTLLGWTPKHSSIDSIIESAFIFTQKQSSF